MAEEETTEELEEIVTRLIDRWERGFIAQTLDEIGEMSTFKAAFVCGMMTAKMSQDYDLFADVRFERFINLIKERFYDQCPTT
jgi:hypothetical protein